MLKKSFVLMAATLLCLGAGCVTQWSLPTKEAANDVALAPASTEQFVAGIFSLGPTDGSYTQEEIWQGPDITGVFIRIPWNSIHLGPGTDDSQFDFSGLDHELDQAVKYNKRVTLSVGAGSDGTPSWIFEEGVERLEFQDGGSDLEPGKCGARLALGDPTDASYQEHYFQALQKLSEHLHENPQWYQAVAYVKLSGANLFTHELRLPSRCEPGCICNGEVWAKAGYTPDGLQDFFKKEMALMREIFPDKPMIYALIQDGFPWMNNAGGYETVDGTSSNGLPLIRSVEQVEAIIEYASKTHGDYFIVSHNGLSPNGSPNRWVVEAGKSGQPTTFQTVNKERLATTGELQLALENLWDNTTAHYLEVYQSVLIDAQNKEGILVPENENEVNTLSEWGARLEQRRQERGLE